MWSGTESLPKLGMWKKIIEMCVYLWGQLRGLYGDVTFHILIWDARFLIYTCGNMYTAKQIYIFIYTHTQVKVVVSKISHWWIISTSISWLGSLQLYNHQKLVQLSEFSNQWNTDYAITHTVIKLDSLCTDSRCLPLQTHQKGKVAFTSAMVILFNFLTQIFIVKNQNAVNTRYSILRKLVIWQ